MASRPAKGKKVVNQDELRRLMRERKQQAERKKRVDSPYAKYNSLEQLSCVVCNVQVKNEILWQAHVLGKQHKDKVSELKVAQQSAEKVPQAPQTSTHKRKASEPEVHDGKKKKASNSVVLQGKTGTSGAGAGLGLLSGLYDDDDDDEDKGDVSSDVKQKGPVTDALPSDFFDSSIPGIPSATPVSHSGSVSKAEVEKPVAEKKDNATETIPEGFFDDPVRDAKVRNVDTPKDHMDKEWEEFQKEMRQVSSASEAIVAEEDEEGRLERQIDEIDEQIECLRRVEVLRTKQEAIKDKVKKMTLEDERRLSGSGSDVEEEDEEELMNVLGRDWRAKGALA